MSERFIGKSSEDYLIQAENFNRHQLQKVSETDADFASELLNHGLRLEAWYKPDLFQDASSPFDPTEGIGIPVVSFSYFKAGDIEPTKRVLLWDGEGFGTHPGHAGQQPSAYIAGIEIAKLPYGKSLYDEDGKLNKSLLAIPSDGGRRNFSMDCILGGDRGYDPIDAATGEAYESYATGWLNEGEVLDINLSDCADAPYVAPETEERYNKELAKQAEVRKMLELTAPELLCGLLPAELAKRLSVPYALGVNQSGCFSVEEGTEYLQECGGVDFSAYGLNQRFLMANSRYPDFAERYMTAGYYGALAGGKFIMVAPFVEHSDEFDAMSPEVSANTALVSGGLPEDFQISKDAYVRQVNAKYIAGFIDENGKFWPNANFMIADQPLLVEQLDD